MRSSELGLHVTNDFDDDILVSTIRMWLVTYVFI